MAQHCQQGANIATAVALVIAVGQIPSLVQELRHVTGRAQKKKKKDKTNTQHSMWQKVSAHYGILYNVFIQEFPLRLIRFRT